MLSLFFFFMILRQQRSTLFPYTTLFRSKYRSSATIRMRRETANSADPARRNPGHLLRAVGLRVWGCRVKDQRDRKSTGLNSSHEWISYAVFCLKKKRHNRLERAADDPN